jgi:tetratricopeptide (TPR) repeat protein
MVDPRIDGLTGPFGYLANPTGILGGVGAGRATQVTWDGALYTGEVELCLVSGDPPRPVAVRTKRLGGGGTPIVHYSWLEGEVKFSVSAFAGALSPGGAPANFLRLQVQRLGQEAQEASIGFGLRRTGGEGRATALGAGALSPGSRYAFDRGCALVDDRAVCVLPSLPPTRRYAVAGEPYGKPFTAADYGVGPGTAALLSLWDLGNRTELTLDLKLPWTPLPPEGGQALQALKQADYEQQADQTVQAWAEEFGRAMQVLLPEAKPLETYRASLAYLLMSTEIPAAGSPVVRDVLRGTALAGEDAALAAQALDRTGRADLARGLVESRLEAPADGDAAALRALAAHAWLTGDRPWAEGAYDRLRALAEQLAGRLNAGELAPGTRQWLSATGALEGMAELAALIGRRDDAGLYRLRYDEALAAAERAVEAQPLAEDTVGALLELHRGLPDSPEPTGFAPEAGTVTELCERLRATREEGLVTEGGLLSPLCTMDLARLHALRGEQEQAVRDLYAVLLHTGSCHEGFTGGVRPWTDRSAPPEATPDPRFHAAYLDLVRDLLVCERRDELHLLSGFSPAWLQPGKQVGAYNAPTNFGRVTSELQVQAGGATLVFVPEWHAPPSRLVLHIPYCVKLTSVTADQPGLKQVEGPGAPEPTQLVQLRPDTTTVTLTWEPRPVEALSYEAAVDAWREAYAARYREYADTGHEPVKLEPIPLR